ncbi:MULTISPECIES: hypothetical protein [Actinosynnema]|uniref:hypothetical protein n=1 Tax=Actinosynnema TaxID=40566 RepID=UPI0020A25877|nr:hypothetical protein [Actinosynnema pretiosum]MCP2092492.1 hypothetical protein [Actinosynnema pretiosum]
MLVTGRTNWWHGPGTAAFRAYSIGENDESNNRASQPVPILVPDEHRSSVEGVLRIDRDGDRTPGADEVLPGGLVSLYGPTLSPPATITDANGRFRFTDVPAAVHGLGTNGRIGGWQTPETKIAVRADTRVDLVAVPGYEERFAAELALTSGEYAPGDRAEAVATLTNLTGSEMTGVRAYCPQGSGSQATEVDLGALATGGTGVTIPAGASLAFPITATVPAGAPRYGAVVLSCQFGPGARQDERVVITFATASVPGPPGSWSGTYFHDANFNTFVDADELVTGLAVSLVSERTGVVVASGATDLAGQVAFADVPAGLYRVELGGPWDTMTSPEHHYVGTCGWGCNGGSTIKVHPLG